jgi:hypothetical protein
MERIEMLKSWIETEPLEPFNYYGLALEYQKLGDARAAEMLDKLLVDFKEYLPTYYTAAKYFEVSDFDKTKTIYEKGIVLATQQGNLKAQQELKNAYQNFLFEND